jgi:chromosome segregation ATPase
MNSDYPRILGLLILATSISASAQSLGDVARQARAEREQSGVPHSKVFTNDDIASHQPASTPQSDTNSKTGDANSSAEAAGNAQKKANDAPGTEEAKKLAHKAQPKDRAAQESETDERTKEINKEYRDRIAAVRAQLATAQQQLAKLQLDQVESTNSFQRSVGTSPNIATYEQQQREFKEQIEAQRNAITGLNSQLEDVQEAARHAGVPHALD